MNLRELEYLVAVAELGTMHAAAARCGVSQPTLSAQLARLEAELDCLLLERWRRGVRLTQAGREAVEHARRVLDAAAGLRRACRATAQPLAGPFRLGLIPTVGPYLTGELLPGIRRGYPNTELYLREEITASLLSRLINTQLDAAIVSPPIDQPALHLEPIGREPFYVIAPAEHPLASRRRVRVEELADQRLLLLEDGHCLREQTVALCRLNPDRSRYQASSVESLRQMVAAGLGVSILPQMAVRGRYARFAGVKVVPIAAPTPARSLALAFRKTHPEFGAIRQLAGQMRQWLAGTR